jgi:orotate phosphoribosyltransferase
VVEDVVTTGESMLQAIAEVEKTGLRHRAARHFVKPR